MTIWLAIKLQHLPHAAVFWLEHGGLLNAPAVHFLVWTRLSQTQFVRARFACTVASTPHLYTGSVPKSNFSSGLINELNFGVCQAWIQGLGVKTQWDKRTTFLWSSSAAISERAFDGFLCLHTVVSLNPLCSYCTICFFLCIFVIHPIF